MVINIGASQNFLRTRKKDENSTIKRPMSFLLILLKLPPHTRYRAHRLLTGDPVAGCGRIGFEPQWSFAHYPHKKRHRSYNEEK